MFSSIFRITFLFTFLAGVFSCSNSNSEASTADSKMSDSLKSEQLTEDGMKEKTSDSVEFASMQIINYGMNKNKVVWVKADKISKTTNIKLDGQLLKSTPHLDKDMVSVQLPDSFNENKTVDIQLIDIVTNKTSDIRKGLLNVEKAYLLKTGGTEETKKNDILDIGLSEMDLTSFKENIKIINFGMNKSKMIWVTADGITDNSLIVLDNKVLNTKAHVDKGSLTASLPASFNTNKNVSFQIIDTDGNAKSKINKGLLNVEDVYLLNLSKE